MKPRFMATGIGSLPHTDPAEALALVRRSFPEAPHWPQLPAARPEEDFTRQYVGPLLRLGLLAPAPAGGRACFAPERPDWVDGLTRFYETYLAARDGAKEALAMFGFSPDAAAGFYRFVAAVEEDPGGVLYLKGQVSGPLSLGFQLSDSGRRAAYYDEQLRDVVVKTVESHARWQVRTLGRLGLPVIIFVDEPALYTIGQSSYITLHGEQVREDLDVVFAAIKDEGGIPGVHVCARADWSIVFSSQARVVNFDAYQYFASLLICVRELKEFLARGGVVAWGLVPTANEARSENVATLASRFHGWVETLAGKGVPPGVLAEQSLVTPSCGTGALTPDLAEHIYRLTHDVAAALRQEYCGSLSSEGAPS